MKATPFAANAAVVVAAAFFGRSFVATRVAVRDMPPLCLAKYGDDRGEAGAFRLEPCDRHVDGTL